MSGTNSLTVLWTTMEVIKDDLTRQGLVSAGKSDNVGWGTEVPTKSMLVWLTL